MQTVLQGVLILSGAGAAAIVLLLLLRPLIKKYISVGCQYYIWILVFVLMLLPVFAGLPEQLSISNLLGHPEAGEQNESGMQTENVAAISDGVGTSVQNETHNPPAPVIIRDGDLTKGNFDKVMQAAAFVWVAGAIVFMGINIINYCAFLYRLRKRCAGKYVGTQLTESKSALRIKRGVDVFRTRENSIPFLLGLVRPAIFLPQMELSDEQLKNILLHELTHYKHKDLLWKWFALTVNAVHWFNPFIYIAVKKFNDDCEVYCDWSVTRNMDSKSKISYMQTILNLLNISVREKHSPFASTICTSKKKLTRRFTMIQEIKRKNRLTTALSILLTATVLSVTVFTGSVFAETAKAGLEYRSSEEAYIIGSAQFSVHLQEGEDYPSWVKTIAGSDGQVDVVLEKMQVRQINGFIESMMIINLAGKAGVVKLSSDQWGIMSPQSRENYGSPEMNKAFKIVDMKFMRFNEQEYPGTQAKTEPYVGKDTGNDERAVVRLAIDQQGNFTGGDIYFGLGIDYADSAAQNKFSHIKVEKGSISSKDHFRDDILTSGWLLTSDIFTVLEGNEVNKKVQGVNISLQKADEKGLLFKTDITIPQAASYVVRMYDSQYKVINVKNQDVIGKSIDLIVLPTKVTRSFLTSDGSQPKHVVEMTPPVPLKKGETYRIEIGILDQQGNIIYRQLEQVSIK